MHLLVLIPVSIVCLTVGVFTGFIIAEPKFRRASINGFRAFERVLVKMMHRKFNPTFDAARVLRDKEFAALNLDDKIGSVDPLALQAAFELKKKLLMRFGNTVAAVYLFGSRVRGDFQRNSDVDVAVFLTNNPDRDAKVKAELIQFTTELLLEYGLYIQLRVFDGDALEPEREYVSPLLHTVLNYGIMI